MLAGLLPAQNRKPSYADLTLVRNRTWSNASFLEVRAGGLYGFPDDENAQNLAESQFGPEGHVYLRQDRAFGREGRFDAYVGTDGAYASLTEGNPLVAKGYSRLEVFGRQWAHYVREGFYQSGDMTLVSSYRSTDWQARLSFATQLTETLKGEVSGFYGQNSYERYSKTPAAYTIPDDYSIYGATLIFEENKVQFDQRSGLPYAGFILAAWVTREWNTSDRLFGITGRQSTLPSAVIRGGGYLEWYLPYSNATTFIITADGAIAPEDDRTYIYDSSKPIGQIWVDGRVDFRVLLGETFTFTPGVRVQWIRIADQFATSEQDEFFFGAQLEARADFGEAFALVAEYSFLTNESRRHWGLTDDSLGEHRLWVGVEFRPFLKKR